MSSEAAIQLGIQAKIQAMSEFADVDVVINDWSIFNQSNEAAPYVLITNADDFNSKQDVKTPETNWEIPVTLIENFTDWPTTLNNFRTRRQAIIDQFNAEGNARSAGGIAGVDITRIRSGGPITAKYVAYTPEEMIEEATPLFLLQPLIFSCEEF